MQDTNTEKSPILYEGKEISELDALKLIAEGALLSEFSFYTRLMSFAAVTHRRTGWQEVDVKNFSKKLLKTAVEKDFHALSVVDKIEDQQLADGFRGACVKSFTDALDKCDKNMVLEWEEILNEQPDKFIVKAIKERPYVVRYLHNPMTEEKLQEVARVAAENQYKKALRKPEELSIRKEFDQDLIVNQKAMEFFTLPMAERTQKRLERIINSKQLLPDKFLKLLLLPMRNSFFYKKKGMIEQAAMAEREKLPFVTVPACKKIAEIHPEAAIELPDLLNPEYVYKFMIRLNKHASEDVFKEYFMKFPKEMLTEDMADGIKITREMLTYAPNVFVQSDKADKYFRKQPSEILWMPEEYQTAKRLLQDGVVITPNKLQYIKNPEMREKIKIALDI